MDIKLFDKVLLESGETAYIVEVYKGGEAFEADIDKKDGHIVTDTIFPKTIKKVIQ